jgi:hypothetical protein
MIRLASACLLWAACVPRLSIDNAPCPCAPDHECCPTLEENMCVPRGHLEACPGFQGCVQIFGGLPPPGFSIALGIDASPEVFPYPDDHRVRLKYGDQNGFHFYLQTVALGLDHELVHVQTRLLDAATGELLKVTRDDRHLLCSAAGWSLHYGYLNFVCKSDPPQRTMVERELTLEVTLTDAEGRTASERAPIRFYCPSDDHPDACLLQCAASS